MNVRVPSEELLPTETVSEVVAAYEAVVQVSNRIVHASDLEQQCARAPTTDEPLSLRWVLVHMVEETARHAGHADILREQIDGQTGR
jgi:hypothetical protein